MESNEEEFLTITLGYMKFKSQFYGLSRKIKNARKSFFKLYDMDSSSIQLS